MLPLLLFGFATCPEAKPALTNRPALLRITTQGVSKNGGRKQLLAKLDLSHQNVPRLLWQTKLDGQNLVTLGPSSPDVLIVSASPLSPKQEWPPDWTKLERRYYALELATGHVRRQFRITDEPDLREAVFGEGLFFVPTYPRDAKTRPASLYSRKELRAISPVTGRTVWRAPCALADAHIMAHNNVVVYQNIEGTTTAADALTGRPIWRFPGQPQSNHTAGIAQGEVYFYGDATDPGSGGNEIGGEYLAAVNLRTGQKTRAALFYKRFSTQTHLEHLEWLSNVERFVGEVVTVGAGVGRFDLQATDSILRPVWERPSTGAFTAIGSRLVCEYESDPQRGPPYEAGLIGLDAATGRGLWRHKGSGGTFLGVWNNVAVLRGGKGGDTLFGVRPRDGATAWMLDLKTLTAEVGGAKSLPTATPSGIQSWELSARISGKYFIVGKGSRTGQTAQIRVYASAGK